MVFQEGMKRIDEARNRLNLFSERAEVLFMISQLTNPHPLERKGEDSMSRFTDICDGLRIEFKETDDYPELKRVEQDGLSVIEVQTKVVEEEEHNNVFGPKKGEKITIISVRQDLSIAEMAKLVRTVCDLSEQEFGDRSRVEQTYQWLEGMKNYSKTLLEAGMAMERVVRLAWEKGKIRNESDFDRYFDRMTQFVYDLGRAVDMDQRKGQSTSVREAYDNLAQEHPADVDEKLRQGLQFARFGKSERQLNGNAGEAFERMADYYLKIRTKQTGDLPQQMIVALIDRTLPGFANEVGQKKQEVAEEARKIPQELLSALVMRGIDKAYRELKIPAWAKELMEVDLKAEEVRKDLAGKLDENLSLAHRETVAKFFLGQGGMKDMKFADLTPGELTRVLTQYADELRTLGLGQKEIEKLSQWWENDRLFSPEMKLKIHDLKSRINYYNSNRFSDFSWSLIPDITGIRSVVEYYGKNRADSGLREEFGIFQKVMVKLLCEEMGLIYSGWENKDVFKGTVEAGPRMVVLRERLNCVGRTWFLTRAAAALNLEEVHTASSLWHLSALMKFADGEEMQVEASGGRVLNEVSPVPDTAGVLRPGERVVEVKGGDRYLVLEPELGIKSAMFENFIIDSNWKASDYLSGEPTWAASALSWYLTEGYIWTLPTVEAVAAEKGLSRGEVIWLIKRLKFLVPDYLDKLRHSEEGEEPDEDCNTFIKILWNKVA